VSEAINIHSSYDISFALARELLTTTTKLACDEQCLYLHQQTNIPPRMLPEALELNLVDDFQRATGKRPDIYIFVIDSLRQDYVIPYDNEANYTPEIASFASDSLVFRNAFSRYAGTTLSEPAIWA